MREIDTDALHGVARSLGVGNPATATRQVTFDDENLQQVWDAQRYARLPILTAGFTESLAALANNVERSSVARSALFTQGEYSDLLEDLGLSDPATTDVYCTGYQCLIDLSDSGNLVEAQMGVRQCIPHQTATPMRVFQGTVVRGGNSLVATDDFAFLENNADEQDEYPTRPWKLEGQAVSGPDVPVLFHLIEANAGGGISGQFFWRLHFCPKDVPIWYAL